MNTCIFHMLAFGKRRVWSFKCDKCAISPVRKKCVCVREREAVLFQISIKGK